MIFVAAARCARPKDQFMYVSAKHSEHFKRLGMIELLPENMNRLDTHRASLDPDMIKVAAWGTRRDMDLVRRLRDSLPSLGDLIEERNWACGQGFKLAGGNVLAPEITGKPWLPAGKMPRYQIDPSVLEPLTETRFHRPRDPKIYRGPLIIAPRGLGSSGFYSAYSGENVIYSSVYLGISFQRQDVGLAHVINAILNSSFTSYFLFMTGSAWGVERDEINPIDLCRLPLPRIEQLDSPTVHQILEVEAQLRSRAGSTDSSELSQSLDDLVFDMYGLDESERILIVDGVNVTIGLRTKR